MSDIDQWFDYVQLTHRYAYGLDTETGAGVADMFTEDGTWDASALGYGTFTGREQLEGYFAGQEGRPEAMAHMFSNHEVLASTVDAMTARSYVHGVVVRAGNEVVRHDVVLYADELVRVDGSWRFARRTLTRVLDFRSTRKVRST